MVIQSITLLQLSEIAENGWKVSLEGKARKLKGK
jgi:hypothetical protein